MSKTVLKYTLTDHGITTCMMPSGSEVLRVGVQSTDIVVWCRADTRNPLVEHKIISCFTGAPIPAGYENAKFITTLQLHQKNQKGEVMELVVHFFDGGEGPGIILPN